MKTLSVEHVDHFDGQRREDDRLHRRRNKQPVRMRAPLRPHERQHALRKQCADGCV
jgi:hypothetical protein